MKASKNNFWNSFAEKYDNFIVRYAQDTYKKLIVLIKNELRESDEVLELGTGTGIISFAVATKVKAITATDYAPAMIDVAIKKQNNVQNINFKLGSANNIQYPNNAFDVVIVSNVFHLLPNAEEALREISRVLKNGGKAILPTYCHGQNIKSRIISAFMSLSGFKAVNKWSTRSFRCFIENEGFIIASELIIEDKVPLSFIVATKRM
jgi:ubiquinone/menaquinone biosynthesis C-methylase UbiE